MPAITPCCRERTCSTDAAELWEAEAKSFGSNLTAQQGREPEWSFPDLSLAPKPLAVLLFSTLEGGVRPR